MSVCVCERACVCVRHKAKKKRNQNPKLMPDNAWFWASPHAPQDLVEQTAFPLEPSRLRGGGSWGVIGQRSK